MSGITINELPNEVIVIVFRFLDQFSLGDAALTCKRWSQLIETSCKWSLVRSYRNKDYRFKPWVDFMLKTKRKFEKVELDKTVLDIDIIKTIELFRRHGANVVQLYLEESHNCCPIRIAELLNCMPNLTRVAVHRVITLHGINDELLESDLPELKKLKTLELDLCNCHIMKCFRKAKLSAIKLCDPLLADPSASNALMDFLKSQVHLTALGFKSVHDRSIVSILSTPMPFQLTRLSLFNCWMVNRDRDDGYKNMLKFLKSQARTLTELELGWAFPDFVLEFIFANFTKLNTLSLTMTGIPRNENFYQQLKINANIENLIFLDSEFDNQETLPFYRGFLKRLPNVENLAVLSNCGNKTLLAVAQSLCKLKRLTISHLDEESVVGVQFPNLNSLHIRLLGRQAIDWNEFIQNNSKLTELAIEKIESRPLPNAEQFGDRITKVNQHASKLSQYFEGDDRCRDSIRAKYPDFQLFNLHSQNASKRFTLWE